MASGVEVEFHCLLVFRSELLDGEQLDDMSVGIAKVNALSSAAPVDLPVLGRPGFAAVRDALRLNAPEDRVELLFAHLERVVMALEPGAVSNSIVSASFTRTGEK